MAEQSQVVATAGRRFEQKKPLVISLANANGANNPLLAGFQRLVYAEYGRRGWLDPGDYPDQMVRGDAFETASKYLIVHNNEDIAAGMRIVRDTGNGFPHEDEIGLNNLFSSRGIPESVKSLIRETPRSQLAEITKVVGKKSLARTILHDIIKCLYWYSKYAGVTFYVMVVDMEFFLLCDKIGVPITPIGTPIMCEGSWTIPAITIPAEYPASISAKSPDGWRYMEDSSNLDDTWNLQ